MASADTNKQKRTSLEPSEIFCAVGLTMPTRDMTDLCRDNTGAAILKWVGSDGINLLKSGKVDYNNEQKFELMFTNVPTTGAAQEKLIANVVAGFSAAIGTKGFMRKMGDNVDVAPAVYMTGSRWPDKVNIFRLRNEDDGFDYNSSDMVIQADDKTFYGIS